MKPLVSSAAIGIDIGGTKIALGIVGSDGHVSEYRYFSSVGESAESIWSQLSGHIHELSKHIDDPQVGIGSAGPISCRDGWVSPVNIPSLKQFPIVERILDLGVCTSAVLHGDAIAFTHAEHRFGAGQGERDMLGMVVSTGIGGGLVLDGRLRMGATGNAGYIGHTVVVQDGDICPCGRRGCVELLSSGPNMVHAARRSSWAAPSQASFRDLADAARAGDQIAVKVIDQGTRALAVAIVNQFAMLDINVAVIGGGVSFSGDVFWAPLQRHVAAEAARVGFLSQPDVRPALLGEHAGVIGAALAVLDPSSTWE